MNDEVVYTSFRDQMAMSAYDDYRSQWQWKHLATPSRANPQVPVGGANDLEEFKRELSDVLAAAATARLKPAVAPAPKKSTPVPLAELVSELHQGDRALILELISK